MTTSELRRAIAERLGKNASDFRLTIEVDHAVCLRVSTEGTVAETNSDDLAEHVQTSTTQHNERAIYVVWKLDTDDWEAAAPHLLTLIDDVAGLVVS